MTLKMLRRRTDDIKLITCISLATFIISTIILAVVMNNTGSDTTSFTLGTFLLCIISVFYFIFTGAFGYSAEFNMAVSMGVTRKQFFLSYTLSTFILVIIQTTIIYIIYFIEKWEVRTFYSEFVYEKSIDSLLNSYMMIPLILGIVVFHVFIGALYMRFGKIVFWVSWLFLMMLCMLPSKCFDAMERADGSFFDIAGHIAVDFWKLITSIGGMMVMLAIEVVALFIGYVVERRQSYTSL